MFGQINWPLHIYIPVPNDKLENPSGEKSHNFASPLMNWCTWWSTYKEGHSGMESIIGFINFFFAIIPYTLIFCNERAKNITMYVYVAYLVKNSFSKIIMQWNNLT